MDILTLIDHIVSLLQQRKRITYGVLKRQFALDDTMLADVTAELIDGQQVAVDEGGKVLVWAGKGINGETDKRRNGNTEEEKNSDLRPSNPELAPVSYTPVHLAERIRAA